MSIHRILFTPNSTYQFKNRLFALGRLTDRLREASIGVQSVGKLRYAVVTHRPRDPS
ncbi:hypothetical protein C8Q74DRAFT_1232478 [Fomes fomentarius]|nr:hypothetical protein C8Q74DRAFT_1232478 [Fomes fomentarius]